MNEQYTLDKWKWSEDDFPTMDWHDCPIHAIAFLPEQLELALDIDYIFKWEQPEKPGDGYRFWISPATMVFKNAYDVKISTDTSWGLQIADLTRTNLQPQGGSEPMKQIEWAWSIDCQEANISVKSAGFDMYVRSLPVLLDTQYIQMPGRGGISFARPTEGPTR